MTPLMHIEKNELNTSFFSKNNIDLLQRTIITNIKTETNVDISRQSDHDLYIIMNYYYSNFSYNRMTDISSQVDTLNKLVLNTVIPMVQSAMRQHSFYIKDKDENINPLDLGASTSIKGLNPIDGPGFLI
jgi:hypothetical protein